MAQNAAQTYLDQYLSNDDILEHIKAIKAVELNKNALFVCSTKGGDIELKRMTLPEKMRMTWFYDQGFGLADSGSLFFAIYLVIIEDDYHLLTCLTVDGRIKTIKIIDEKEERVKDEQSKLLTSFMEGFFTRYKLDSKRTSRTTSTL